MPCLDGKTVDELRIPSLGAFGAIGDAFAGGVNCRSYFDVAMLFGYPYMHPTPFAVYSSRRRPSLTNAVIIARRTTHKSCDANCRGAKPK